MRALIGLCFVTLLGLCCSGSVWAVSCPVAAPHAPSEAAQAYLRAEYDRASTLYLQALQANPYDPQLTAGLVDVFLKQQRVEEAANVLQKAIAVHPRSVVLQTSLGLTQYREGEPQLAASTAVVAMGIDPCYPRLRLLEVLILRLNSMFKSAADRLRIAHLLDPYDPEIRRRWISTLPLQQRISEEEAYLASANGNDPDDLRRMHLYLEALKKYAAEPHKSCQLVSSSVSTEIPFARIMRDATHIQAFGLDVKLNGHNARLEIDTGASGLVLGRSIAKKAGLEAFAQTEFGGVGSGPERSGYTAYVDAIKIGTLEFRDCEVEVLDTNNVVGIDGLVGMDVFSKLLVTLDYPMRKLDLGPLPQRPQETSPAKPSLDTDDAQDADIKASTDAKAAATSRQDRYIAPEMRDWTKVYRIGHQLIIPAALNQSKPKLFILDTGAFTTSISPEAAREVTKVHSDNSLTVRGLSGKVEKVYEADDVTFTFANVRQPGRGVVAFDMSNISKHNGLNISGFIGFATLGQMTVKIDYRDALVKFDYHPGRGYH
jgi:predicted aspartyl protease/Flp pilus assembly protein TadD